MDLFVNGTQLTNDLIISKCMYHDYAYGHADVLDISIQDKDDKLLKSGMDKGICIKANANDISTGNMYISSISFPGETVNIRAMSTKIEALSQKSYNRFQITNYEIIKEVAAELELKELSYLANEYTYDIVERLNKNALSYLSDLYLLEGTVCKIYDDNLIVYNEREFEEKSSQKEVKKDDFILKPSFLTSDTKLVSSVTNSYVGKNLIKTKVESGISGKKVFMNQKVSDIAESIRISKCIMRCNNKNQYLGNGKISSILPAGVTFYLDGDYGVFCGKQFVTNASHDLVKSQSLVNFRKVIEGDY